MLLRQFVSKGLVHYSYLVGDGREAAVIDPRRDCGDYADLARANGMRIEEVFDTHRNEDIVSGSRELSEASGAPACHGAAEPIRYGQGVSDGERFRIGGLTLSVIGTPGHTPGSISLALHGPAGPLAVFTGDALFAGETGRVDFLGPARAAEMAGALHDSLRGKVLPLGDGVAVHPAHGKGSLCGAGIEARRSTTIGEERRSNPAFVLDRDAFVRRKAGERLPTPPYFRRVEELNTRGAPPNGTAPAPGELDAAAFGSALFEGAQAVDARPPGEFAVGHIPGSLSLWRDMMSPLAGWTLDASAPVLLVEERGDDAGEAARQLRRIGVDSLAGRLRGGFQEWSWSGREAGAFRVYSPDALARRLGQGRLVLLDVRSEEAYAKGRIAGAVNAHFASAERAVGGAGSDEVVAYCASGVTASLCLSLLRRRGLRDAGILIGGFDAWTAAGKPVEP